MTDEDRPICPRCGYPINEPTPAECYANHPTYQ